MSQSQSVTSQWSRIASLNVAIRVQSHRPRLGG